MPALEPREGKPHLRLVVSREPVHFSRDEIAEVQACFDVRSAGSRWCGVGAVGTQDAHRLVLFATTTEGRYFSLTPFNDGVVELAGESGHVIERAASLSRMLASFERRCALH